MKIYLGTDHAGFELKEKIKSFLLKKNYDVQDCGAFEFNQDDDYPDFISKVSEEVSNDPENSKGIIFGGSGQAEAMLANKFKNIRCALFYSLAIPASAIDAVGTQSDNPYEIIKLTRTHNNANILSLGARFLKQEEAINAISIWLETSFVNEERHVRRINKIKELENNNSTLP
jgi:ribose 5-phosphate isomerase B